MLMMVAKLFPVLKCHTHERAAEARYGYYVYGVVGVLDNVHEHNRVEEDSHSVVVK